MSVKELVAQTPEILGNYPNTYTFTKALCERIMKRRRGDLPITIIRPSIINTSYLEPFPGWLDSIAAAAAYFMFIGLGIVKEVQCHPDKVGDFVPVDVVCANIIVASAFNARSKTLNIYHVGSSDRNPVRWKMTQSVVQDFWNTNISESRVSKSQILINTNPTRIKIN